MNLRIIRNIVIIFLSTCFACKNTNSIKENEVVKIVHSDSAYFNYLTTEYNGSRMNKYRQYSMSILGNWKKECLKGNDSIYGELITAYYYMNKKIEGLGISMVMAEKYNSPYAFYNIYEILVEDVNKKYDDMSNRIALYYLLKGYEVCVLKSPSKPYEDSNIRLENFVIRLKENFGENYSKYNSQNIMFDSSIKIHKQTVRDVTK